MDRQTKEAQDRNLILPKTPCVGMSGDALLECLYNTDAHILDKALPDSYQLFDAGTTLFFFHMLRVRHVY